MSFNAFRKKTSLRLPVFWLAIVLLFCCIGTNAIMQQKQNAYADKVDDARIWWSDEETYLARFTNSYGVDDYTHIFYACFGKSNDCNDDYTRAFCAQPNAGLPLSMATWYPYYVVTYVRDGSSSGYYTSVDKTNKIKLLLYIFYYRGTTPAKNAIKYIFTDRKWDVSDWKKLYGYTHAALGYLYDGGKKGLEKGYMDNPSWVDDFEQISTDLGKLISDKSEVWQNAQDFNLYGTWNTGGQDVLWISRKERATLTGVAVDTSGKEISDIANVSSTVQVGESANITARSKSGWKFKGWRTNKTSGTPSGQAKYEVGSLESNTTVYAVYETIPPQTTAFQAKADVSGNSTDYVDAGSTYKIITCTDTSNGCSVNFTFYLKRVSGSGGTTYKIMRRPVGASTYEDVATGQSFSPSNSNGQQVKAYDATIKPGQSICYRITYYPYGSSSTDTTNNVTACAYAEATLGSTISLNVKRNNKDDNSATIYAKPGDSIELTGLYSPAVQYAANLKSTQLRVGDSINGKSGTIQSRFKTLTDSYWVNEFTIQFGKENSDKQGEVGSTDQLTKTVSYSISNEHVGNSFATVAKTNANSGRIAPKSAAINYISGTGFRVTVDPSAISSATKTIVVPYNFTTSTTLDEDDKTVLYAGEKIQVGYNVKINERENKTVGATYATKAGEAKWGIRILDENGNVLNPEQQPESHEGTLNGNQNPVDDISLPDVKAGTTLCLQSYVTPSSSGADTNTNPKDFDSSEATSKKCYTIAKKPSLQVWGGNIYSSGSIDTSVAKKNQLDGINKDNDEPPYTFGSWGELGIISGGTVTGLASGAGYANELGANKEDFCFVSTLSFANSNCNNGTTGSLGVSSSFTNLSNDKKTVIDKLIGSIEPLGSADDLGEIGEDSGITLVGNGTGDIEIKDSIIYGGTYTTLDSMPKVVIYAKNVNIYCTVTRIDALIIATDTVNTCSNPTDQNNPNDPNNINAANRSNPLQINGAVLTNKLIAGRTYGAATGTNSGISAEIINFDPSLYLWGEKQTETDQNVYNTSSYLRELAPRY